MRTEDAADDPTNLHRAIKIMENDRQRYAEQSQGIIKEQRRVIDKMRAENEQLKEQLALESRSMMQPNDAATQSKLARLQDQADLYTRKIELERRKLEEIDKHVKVLEAKLLETQQARGGVNATRQSDQQVNKQIRVLENRLDKALVRFNEALAYNKSLREQIDNLRRERVVFDQINTKLNRELHEKKKEMASIIEVSNVAYEARDQAQTEMNALRSAADTEQAQFEKDWRELGKLLEQDRKYKTGVGGPGDFRGKMTADDEAKLKKSVIKGNWALAREKAAQKASLDKVQSFEEAFQQIKAATGIDNIDELVQTFIDAEDQNFSLFNYVNELNNEVEKLEEQITEIRGDIEKYKGQGGQNDRQRKKLLKDLEDRLASTEAKAEQYEAKAQRSAMTVTQLEQGIQSIFNKIGCDKSSLSEMLGSTGVTESNMMQYLGIIEQRTNELLAGYNAKNAHLATHSTAAGGGAGGGGGRYGGGAPGSSAGLQSAGGGGGGVNSATATSANNNNNTGANNMLSPVTPAGASSGGDHTLLQQQQQSQQQSTSGAGRPVAPAGAATINIDPPVIGDDDNSEEDSEEDDERPLSRDELKAKTLRGMTKRENQRQQPGKAKKRGDARFPRR